MTQPDTLQGKIRSILKQYFQDATDIERNKLGFKEYQHFTEITTQALADLFMESKLAEIDPKKEYLLIVSNYNPEDYVGVAKKIPQVKLIVAGDVTVEEIKKYLKRKAKNRYGE